MAAEGAAAGVSALEPGAEPFKSGGAKAGGPLSLRPGQRIAAMPLPLAPALLPLLVAATPLPSDAYKPYVPSTHFGGSSLPAGPLLMESAPVETFDPIARAALIRDQMPRLWSGSYVPFDGATQQPVELSLEQVSAAGQMVVLVGEIRVADMVSPVQGNLNAKSDQLDLLVLGDAPGPTLEPGGSFQGVQGMTLAGWNADRLTAMGGRLVLSPIARPTAAPIRGLW